MPHQERMGATDCGKLPGAEEGNITNDKEEVRDAPSLLAFFLLKQSRGEKKNTGKKTPKKQQKPHNKSYEGPLGNIQECLKQKKKSHLKLHPEITIVNSLTNFLF